jgi:GxxExxY protein
MTINDITGMIVDAAYTVHTRLGPGLLESVYEVAVARELTKRGLKVARQVPIPIAYDGTVFDEGFRADLLVEDMVIVELKSVEELHPVHPKQLLTYLRLADKRVGLLINFNVPKIKDGIKRIVNGLPESGRPEISRRGTESAENDMTRSQTSASSAALRDKEIPA